MRWPLLTWRSADMPNISPQSQQKDTAGHFLDSVCAGRSLSSTSVDWHRIRSQLLSASAASEDATSHAAKQLKIIFFTNLGLMPRACAAALAASVHMNRCACSVKKEVRRNLTAAPLVPNFACCDDYLGVAHL